MLEGVELEGEGEAPLPFESGIRLGHHVDGLDRPASLDLALVGRFEHHGGLDPGVSDGPQPLDRLHGSRRVCARSRRRQPGGCDRDDAQSRGNGRCDRGNEKMNNGRQTQTIWGEVDATPCETKCKKWRPCDVVGAVVFVAFVFVAKFIVFGAGVFIVLVFIF